MHEHACSSAGAPSLSISTSTTTATATATLLGKPPRSPVARGEPSRPASRAPTAVAIYLPETYHRVPLVRLLAPGPRSAARRPNGGARAARMTRGDGKSGVRLTSGPPLAVAARKARKILANPAGAGALRTAALVSHSVSTTTGVLSVSAARTYGQSPRPQLARAPRTPHAPAPALFMPLASDTDQVTSFPCH